MGYDFSKLRGRIVEKFGTVGNFSNAMDLSRTSVSHKLNNKSAFTPKNIETWAKLLDIDSEDYGSYFFVKKVYNSK